MAKFKVTPEERRQFQWDILKTGLLMICTFAFAASIKVYRPLSVDARPALERGLWVGAAILGAMSTGYFLIRGKAPSAFAFLLYAWAGLTTGISTVFLGNALLDTSLPIDHSARVLSKDTTTYGNRVRSRLIVSSWRSDSTTETLYLGGEMNQKLVDDTSIGDTVVVRTKRGRFGYEWMGDVSWPSFPSRAPTSAQ